MNGISLTPRELIAIAQEAENQRQRHIYYHWSTTRRQAYALFMQKDMNRLLGKTLQELQAIAQEVGLPRFAGKQLAEWIYIRRATSFDEMTNISLKGREALKANYSIGRHDPVAEAISKDGTKKYLFPVKCSHKRGLNPVCPEEELEAGAIEAGGHKVLTIPHHNGKLSAEAVDAYIEAFRKDEAWDHMVWPGMVYISHPTEYGTLYTLEELKELSGLLDQLPWGDKIARQFDKIVDMFSHYCANIFRHTV